MYAVVILLISLEQANPHLLWFSGKSKILLPLEPGQKEADFGDIGNQ
jgi:hypothetical protein